MPPDIQDILFVFLVSELPRITRGDAPQLPVGLYELIHTEVLEYEASLPFPADLRDLLLIYALDQNSE